MKRLCLLTLFFFISDFTFAQVSVFVGGGIGSYNMSDMKDLQQEFVNEFPVQPRITSSFPSFGIFEFTALARINPHLSIGGHVGYCSSGGRVDYSDYSGEVRLDQIVRSYTIGIPIRLQLNESKKNIVSFEMMPLVILGALDVKTLSRIGVQESYDKISFVEKDAGIQPSFIFNKNFKNIGFYIKAGFLIQLINSKLYVKDDRSEYLLNAQGQEVHLDWTGLRASGGISYTF